MTDSIHHRADCPDCGPVTLHQNRCSRCGGDSWRRPGPSFEQRLEAHRRESNEPEVMRLAK